MTGLPAKGPPVNTRPESASTPIIRPICPDDAAAVHTLRLLPSVLRNTTPMPSLRLDDVRKRIDALGPDDHQFVAELDGAVVGMAGLHVGTGKWRHVGEIGIFVHDDFQGRGIGRALMHALLDVADTYLGLVRVELSVIPDNVVAVRLYESLGFEREGVKRQALMVEGRLADLLMMGRLRAAVTAPAS